MDLQRFDMIKRWPKSMTPINIWIFLGLAGYYRWFVESFSSIIASLTNLTQKKIKFLCSDASKGSFEKPKRKLTLAPILT